MLLLLFFFFKPTIHCQRDSLSANNYWCRRTMIYSRKLTAKLEDLAFFEPQALNGCEAVCFRHFSYSYGDSSFIETVTVAFLRFPSLQRASQLRHLWCVLLLRRALSFYLFLPPPLQQKQTCEIIHKNWVLFIINRIIVCGVGMLNGWKVAMEAFCAEFLLLYLLVIKSS